MPGSHGVQLRIVNKPATPETFQKAADLIKSSGAEFDASEKVRWLWLTGDKLQAETLDPLFEAAREYGAIVTITRN
jgi:hypothetical protein